MANSLLLAVVVTEWKVTPPARAPVAFTAKAMAQDFSAAFKVGADDKHIATVDADGVALAAIQGLNQVVKEKEARIQALERTVAELKELVTRFTEPNQTNR